MQQMKHEQYRSNLTAHLISLFPERLRSALTNYLKAYVDISEVRIRISSPVAFTLNGSNLMTGMMISRDDISYVIERITEGNFFKNEEIMRQGYVTLPYGMRAGICGDVFVSGGTVKTLKTVTSIYIRIPSAITVPCDKVIEHIEKSAYTSSILVISPPGGGKTTLLRSIINSIGAAPVQKRVSVIDTNRELVLPYDRDLSSVDALSGYPKPYGISVAIRYLNPEYVIFDELGGSDETDALLECMHSGVPIITSAHSGSFSELSLKKNVVNILNNGVFDTVIRIKRIGKLYEYEIKRVSEI